MGQVRTSSPTPPTTVSSGVDGNLTSPRVLTFSPYSRPVLVFNNTGNTRVIRVKINATSDTDFGGASDDGIGYFQISDGKSTEVSLGGLLSVFRVSFVTTNAGDDLDDVIVTGWLP